MGLFGFGFGADVTHARLLAGRELAASEAEVFSVRETGLEKDNLELQIISRFPVGCPHSSAYQNSIFQNAETRPPEILLLCLRVFCAGRQRGAEQKIFH